MTFVLALSFLSTPVPPAASVPSLSLPVEFSVICGPLIGAPPPGSPPPPLISGRLNHKSLAQITIEDAMRRDTAAPSFWGSAFCAPFAHVGFAC